MSLRSALLAIISELVLWVMILGFLYGFGAFVGWWGPHAKHLSGQTLYLEFADANQLSVGSPVNFLGTDIGFVTQVKPMGNKIRVQVKTYPDAVSIPQGAHFTIQFNGLAGAKTVEILPSPPPETPTPQPTYVIEDTIRLRDVMNTQMVLAQALESSSNNFSRSLGEFESEEVLIYQLEQARQKALEVTRTLVFTYEMMQDQNNKVHSGIVNVIETIGSFNNTLQRIEKVTEPRFFGTNAMSTIRYLTFATEDTYHVLVHAKNEYYLEQLEKKVATSRKNLQAFTGKIHRDLPHFISGTASFNRGLQRTHHYLAQLEKVLLKTTFGDSLKRFRLKTQSWAKATRRLNP